MYFLGIDGGGTKTAFYLMDSGGEVLSYQGGHCAVSIIGREGLTELLQGFTAEMKHRGIAMEHISYTCAGISAFTEDALWDQITLEVFREFFHDNFFCCNDAVIAWAGSLDCSPGINLIAGTGTIAYGVNENGESARSGGWGWAIGDEGSGYWLGLQLLSLFSKQADGRMPRGALYSLVREHFHFTKDFELINLVHNVWNCGRREIASLSALLPEAARLGDPSILPLILKTAEELASMVKGILLEIPFKKEVSISYSGGVFNMGALLLNPLRSELDKLPCKYTLKQPQHSPVKGAALYAKKLFDGLKT